MPTGSNAPQVRSSRSRRRPCASAATNLPIAGGGYFRLLPYAWTQWGIARVNARRSSRWCFTSIPGKSIRTSRGCRWRRLTRCATTAASTRRSSGSERLVQRFRLRYGHRRSLAARPVASVASCGEAGACRMMLQVSLADAERSRRVGQRSSTPGRRRGLSRVGLAPRVRRTRSATSRSI